MSLPDAVWDYIADGMVPTRERVREALDGEEVRLGAQGVEQGRADLAARVLGAGPLEPLLADPAVTDVLVNGGSEVWVDAGHGLVRFPCRLGDEAQLRALAVRLAGLCGRRLDDASPYVDGVLPGGIRLHAILPPVSGAVHVSLRVPRRVAPRLADLVSLGAFAHDTADLLARLVRAKLSFVVSGGTGSGKTTLLGALLAEVPATDRLVVVEDVRELAIDHPHVVRLQTRPANVEGYGEVGLVSLVRQSLRMRPDRLVVGEVRGAEVRELLTALNTGHEGGCGTIHANAPADVVSRFEALGALAGMSPAAVAAQLRSAVHVVLHLRRDGSRRALREVSVVDGADAGRPRVVPALRAQPGGVLAPAAGWPRLRAVLSAPGTDGRP